MQWTPPREALEIKIWGADRTPEQREGEACGALIAHGQASTFATELQADTALVATPSDTTITAPTTPTLGSQLLAI